MRKKLIEVLTANRKSEIELLNEFCKKNNFDMWAIGKSYQDYGERLRDYEREGRSTC